MVSRRTDPPRRPAGRLARLRFNLARESGKLLRKLLAPPGMRELPPRYPQDFSEFSRGLWDRVRPHTMTSRERIVTLEQAARHVVAHRIPGDIVECGVGAGGSMMAVALTLLELGEDDRRLFLLDTFEGMPEPGEADVNVFGKSARRKYLRRVDASGRSTWHNFPLERVRENMRATGYPAERLCFVEGRVQDTLPDPRIDEVALLRLDTNLYESTRHELVHLFPRLSRGGVLVVDDYNLWLGQRRAVEEYFAEHGVRMLLTRIDDHGVQGMKC